MPKVVKLDGTPLVEIEGLKVLHAEPATTARSSAFVYLAGEEEALVKRLAAIDDISKTRLPAAPAELLGEVGVPDRSVRGPIPRSHPYLSVDFWKKVGGYSGCHGVDRPLSSSRPRLLKLRKGKRRKTDELKLAKKRICFGSCPNDCPCEEIQYGPGHWDCACQ